MSPGDRLGIVALTNGAPVGVAEGVAATFMDTALYGRPTRDWFQLYRQAFAAMMKDQTSPRYAEPPASPTPPAEHAAYENLFFGEIAIVEMAGSRSSRPPGHDLRHDALRPRCLHVCHRGRIGGRHGGHHLRAGRGRQGDRVVVENLDVRGEGTITRAQAAPTDR